MLLVSACVWADVEVKIDVESPIEVVDCTSEVCFNKRRNRIVSVLIV